MISLWDFTLDSPMAKYLKHVQFLWLWWEWRKYSLFKRRLQGIWHFTSVQSIIIRVEGYFSLNCSGMCLFIISLVGHMGTSLSLKYKRFTQVIIILLIVVWDTPYRWARCSSGKPCLSLHKVIKSSSLGCGNLGQPGFGNDSKYSSFLLRTVVSWPVDDECQ